MNQITSRTSQRQAPDSLDMDNLKFELKRIAEVKDRESNHKSDIGRREFELSEKKEQAEMAFVEKRFWADREISLENAIGELRDENVELIGLRASLR